MDIHTPSIESQEDSHCLGCNQPEPMLQDLEAWSFEGICEAVDGCIVEPDGLCPHGLESWLLHLGMI